MFPYFLRSEDHFAGATRNHGAGGEWRVERQRLRWDILDAFAEACARIGIPVVEDLNADTAECVGYFQVNQRGGWRWNTTKGFLRPARGRANLSVLADTEVESILFESRRATGVTVRRGDRREEIRASGEVIVSAGAINSPKLLMLSGIGPADHLAELGIATRLGMQGVGANLQDHLQLRCSFRVSGVETLNARAASMMGKARIGLEYTC